MIYNQLEVDKKIIHEIRFSGVSDFFDTAMNGITDCPARNRRSRDLERQDEGWTYTKRFEDMEPLCKHGWKGGREKVIPLADYLTDLIGSRIIQPSLTWNVAGGCVDVGKYLAGEPDCMLDFQTRMAEGAGKIVTITVNIGASSYVSQESIVNRGAALCAFIDLLHMSGYTCEINCVETCTPSNRDSMPHQADTWIPVKMAEDVLDEDQLSLMLMHPGILRRFVFSVEEQLPARVRDIFGFEGHGGYGRVTEMPKSGEELMGDIYMKPLGYDASEWGSVEDAGKWVTSQLKALGFQLEDLTNVPDYQGESSDRL